MKVPGIWTPRNTAVAILREVRRHLALPNVWKKGAKWAYHPEHACISSALARASASFQGRRKAALRLRSVMPPKNRGDMVGWNDARKRTLADVLRTLDRAILNRKSKR